MVDSFMFPSKLNEQTMIGHETELEYQFSSANNL